MAKDLGTSEERGSFKFITNLIFINKYQAEQKDYIESCLKSGITRDAQDEIYAREVKAVILHEVAHFLDMTTTRWGLEYIFRKLQFIEQYEKQQNYNQTLDVFMLNTTEVSMHSAFLAMHDGSNLSGCTLHHSVLLSEVYGPLVQVFYFRQGNICHEVPLSMLSLIEANAYANELLSKISSIENSPNADDSIVALRLVTDEFNNLLYNPKYSEYTLLLYLTRIHYPELSLKELLIFFSTLARFSLDLSPIEISRLSYSMLFFDTRASRALIMDMRRGASRQVITFKTILLMYEWLQNAAPKMRETHIEVLKTNPLSAILSFWEQLTGTAPQNIDDYIIEPTLELIQKKEVSFLDFDIVSASMEYNREQLQLTPIGLLPLENLKLMDLLLVDKDTEIRVPNRIDISVKDYYYNYFDLTWEIEGICFNRQREFKFFMPPEVIPKSVL